MDNILNDYYNMTIKTLNIDKKFYRNNITRRKNRDYIVEYVVTLERNNKYITFKDKYNARIMNTINRIELLNVIDKIKVKYEDEILIDLYLLNIEAKR